MSNPKDNYLLKKLYLGGDWDEQHDSIERSKLKDELEELESKYSQVRAVGNVIVCYREFGGRWCVIYSPDIDIAKIYRKMKIFDYQLKINTLEDENNTKAPT